MRGKRATMLRQADPDRPHPGRVHGGAGHKRKPMRGNWSRYWVRRRGALVKGSWAK